MPQGIQTYSGLITGIREDKFNFPAGMTKADKLIELKPIGAMTTCKTVNMFASPEATAARDLMGKGEEEHDDIQNSNNYAGIDVPLAECLSSDKSKEKASNLKDIINTYYSPNVQSKSSSRWRRATICASMCAKLEKSLKEKTWNAPKRLPTPMPPRAPPIAPRPPSAKPSRSPRNKGKRVLPPATIHNQNDKDKGGDNKDQNHNDAGNIVNNNSSHTLNDPKQLGHQPHPPQTLHRNKEETEQNQTSSYSKEETKTQNGCNDIKAQSPTNDSDSDSSSDDDSSCDDTMSMSTKSCPTMEMEPEHEVRMRARWGRRGSLPGNTTCLPRQFCPTPPSVSNFQKTISRPSSALSRQSLKSAALASPKIDRESNGKGVSLTSNLQTNRAIVNKLFQKRSSMISSLKSSGSCSTKSEDFAENESSGQLRGNRLINRRASLDVASLAQFNQPRMIRDSYSTKSEDFSDSECSGQFPIRAKSARGSRLVDRRASLDVASLTQFNQTMITQDSCSTKSEDFEESECSGQFPVRGSRLMDRRASLDVASLAQFNKSRNSSESSFKVLKQRSTSLDSLLCKHRMPSPIAEGSECSESEEAQKYSLPESQPIKTSRSEYPCPRPPTSDNRYGSDECLSSQSRNLHSDSLPAFPAAPHRERRRASTPNVRDIQMVNSQKMQQVVANKRAGTRIMRSDAEIVRNVEDEIQQRILRRKQQLLNEQGGGNTFKRFHNRLNCRSAGHKLKKVIEDLNSKRTTAELLQMADAKRGTDLYDVTLTRRVQNFIKDY